jgi:nitrous oxidase accessory protein
VSCRDWVARVRTGNGAARRPLRTLLLILTLLLLSVFALTPAAAQAEGRVVTPRGEFSSLSEALEEAEDGETIEVYGGVYEGPIIIDRPLTLLGHDWPVVDGGGQGNVLQLIAPGITVNGFIIRNSGDLLYEENAGISVEASNAVLENNRLEETLFGIYLREAPGTVIRGNVISSKDLDVPRRGDAIRVWFSNDVIVEGNVAARGRDVVLWYSENLTVRDNEVTDGRYGLHFMYCDDATIENNLLANNSVGTFLMYSRRLHLVGNTIAHNRGPSGFGVGLKDMDDALVENNLFLDNRIGAHLDNSPREIDSIGQFKGNVFAFNDVGVTLMPSVRHNEFSGNSFVENEQQVAIAGGGARTSSNEWTVGDQGNYWSNYVGYDGDADGRGDVPYKAERLFESLVDQNSSLRLFVYSPVEQAVDFAARAIPFVKPQPTLSDEAPLMEPVIPKGLPETIETNNRPMWLAALGLLLLAGLVLAVGVTDKFGFRISNFEMGLNSYDSG